MAAGVDLKKDSIDLGIVVTNVDAATTFYRDILGLKDAGEQPVPGGTMRRFQCGTSMIKLVSPKRPGGVAPAPGGIFAGTGYRYWTITVSNLDAVVAACEAAGRPVPVGRTEVRRGVSIAMIEDPDGNWIELLEAS